MTLCELSADYAESARLIADRVQMLRFMERASTNEADRVVLHRRIADLRPLLRQCREVQRLTAHYYDRSYCRDASYIL